MTSAMSVSWCRLKPIRPELQLIRQRLKGTPLKRKMLIGRPCTTYFGTCSDMAVVDCLRTSSVSC